MVALVTNLSVERERKLLVLCYRLALLMEWSPVSINQNYSNSQIKERKRRKAIIERKEKQKWT